MSPVAEARIAEVRRSHPVWGADRIRYQLERDGIASAGPDQTIGRWCGTGWSMPSSAAAAVRPSAVGTGSADGAVADGCGRRLPSGRWD